jgi:hypothetical protein
MKSFKEKMVEEHGYWRPDNLVRCIVDATLDEVEKKIDKIKIVSETT